MAAEQDVPDRRAAGGDQGYGRRSTYASHNGPISSQAPMMDGSPPAQPFMMCSQGLPGPSTSATHMPTASAASSSGHGMMVTTSGQLPDHTPLGSDDPVEQAMLLDYLRMVKALRGDQAAADAAATAGFAPVPSQYIEDTDLSNLFHAAGSGPPADTSPTAVAAAALASSAAQGHAPSMRRGSAGGVEKQMVGNILSFIQDRKLMDITPRHPHAESSAMHASAGGVQHATSVKVWIQPSGPRQPGQGVEDLQQGILSAEEDPNTGEIRLRVTLLAAGFVIGPSGSTVRVLSQFTDADIKSWTEEKDEHDPSKRQARVFIISGEPQNVAQALFIINAAVDRYRELCDSGRYKGQAVSHKQQVLGMEFCYQPPPKNKVPHAASLRGTHPLTYKQNHQAPEYLGGLHTSANSSVGMTYRADAGNAFPHSHMEAMATAYMAAYAAMMPTMFAGMMPAPFGMPHPSMAASFAAAAASGMGAFQPMPGLLSYNPNLAAAMSMYPGVAPFPVPIATAAGMLEPPSGFGNHHPNFHVDVDVGQTNARVMYDLTDSSAVAAGADLLGGGSHRADSMHSSSTGHAAGGQLYSQEERPETPPAAAVHHQQLNFGGGGAPPPPPGGAGVWRSYNTVLGVPPPPLMSPGGPMPAHPLSPGPIPWLVPQGGSPTQHIGPLMGPLPGMVPYAAGAPSPVRVLNLGQGPVPVVELGGCTYFPASPSPGRAGAASPMAVRPAMHMFETPPDTWQLLAHDNRVATYMSQQAIGVHPVRRGIFNDSSATAVGDQSYAGGAAQQGSSSAVSSPAAGGGGGGGHWQQHGTGHASGNASSAAGGSTAGPEVQDHSAVISPTLAAIQQTTKDPAAPAAAADQDVAKRSSIASSEPAGDQGSAGILDGQDSASNTGPQASYSNHKAAAMKARSVRPLQSIPEAVAALDQDARTPDQGSGRHKQHTSSSDPIVSPGRITLASKVKAYGMHIPSSLAMHNSQKHGNRGPAATEGAVASQLSHLALADQPGSNNSH